MDGPFIDDFPSELNLHLFWGFSMAMLVITRCVPWVAPSDSETAMNPSLYRCPAQDPCCPRGFPAALSGSICKKQAPFFAHELILMTKEFHYFNFFNNLLAASSGCFF